MTDKTQTAILSPDAPQPRGFYSQAVKAGPLLFLAGQLPLDKDGNLSGSTAGEQAAQVIRNLEAVLKAAGGTLANLTQVTVYVTDVEHWPDVNGAYQSLLGGVPVPPARAIVPVKHLHYGALVEMQAIAWMPETGDRLLW